MTCLTPADLGVLTNDQIVAHFSTNGARTGFGYYDGATTPAHFVSTTAFYNLAVAEGFFTGCYPKLYYTPRQISLMSEAQFFLRIQEEGATDGDFAAGLVCHSPGQEDCDILSDMRAEGYITGCPDMIAAADPAFSDYECGDGRCYGTCCLAPTQGDLEVRVDGGQYVGSDREGWSMYQEDAVTLEFDCDVRVLLFMSYTIVPGTTTGTSPNTRHDFRCFVDGVQLDRPWLESDDSTDVLNWRQYAETGYTTIPANTPTEIRIKGRRDWDAAGYNNTDFDLHLMYLVFKESCT